MGFKSPSLPSSQFSGALWQRPIEHFANGLAVGYGRVFTTDNSGNVNCFDSTTGETVWNSSLDGTRSHHIALSENRVYVGFRNSQVGCFDLNNGTLLWSFENAQAPNSMYDWTPRIIVKDGQLFAITDTISAHNATTGELLWQALPGKKNFDIPYSLGQMQTFPLSGDPFDGKYVYAIGGNFSNLHYFKINAENGSVIWRSNVTWNGEVLTLGADRKTFIPSVYAISQEKVIVKIIFQKDYAVNLLLCLDSNTGKELWRIDVGAKVYNPAVHNDLLLFGAADGYFYALDLADGTVAWKTKVDAHNLFSSGVHSSSLIQIDSDNQRIFWSYAVEQNETSNNYTGAIISLNLADGNVIWTTQTNSSCGGLAFNNLTDMLFLTTYRFAADVGLYIFNASTGDLIDSQQFDHYILPPVVQGKETFVAADLWLTVY